MNEIYSEIFFSGNTENCRCTKKKGEYIVEKKAENVFLDYSDYYSTGSELHWEQSFCGEILPKSQFYMSSIC